MKSFLQEPKLFMKRSKKRDGDWFCLFLWNLKAPQVIGVRSPGIYHILFHLPYNQKQVLGFKEQIPCMWRQGTFPWTQLTPKLLERIFFLNLIHCEMQRFGMEVNLGSVMVENDESNSQPCGINSSELWVIDFAKQFWFEGSIISFKRRGRIISLFNRFSSQMETC